MKIIAVCLCCGGKDWKEVKLDDNDIVFKCVKCNAYIEPEQMILRPNVIDIA